VAVWQQAAASIVSPAIAVAQATGQPASNVGRAYPIMTERVRDSSAPPLSTLLRRFACARLSQPCLPGSCPDVSATFTNIAFDKAACGGLRSAPDCRPRRTFLHLSYSCAVPFGPAILVTQV